MRPGRQVAQLALEQGGQFNFLARGAYPASRVVARRASRGEKRKREGTKLSMGHMTPQTKNGIRLRRGQVSTEPDGPSSVGLSTHRRCLIRDNQNSQLQSLRAYKGCLGTCTRRRDPH